LIHTDLIIILYTILIIILYTILVIILYMITLNKILIYIDGLMCKEIH